MKKIFIIYIILSLTACVEKKEGIQVDVLEKNDTISVTYTNFSDTIYIVNGILFDIFKDNESPKHYNSDEPTPEIYHNANNETPNIRSFFYQTNKDELYLQKMKDSIYKRPKNEDYYPFENILIIYPKTSKTVYSKINLNKENQKLNLKVIDFHELNYGKIIYEQVSPILKDVNPNYYLYRYRFNSHSKLKINLQ